MADYDYSRLAQAMMPTPDPNALAARLNYFGNLPEREANLGPQDRSLAVASNFLGLMPYARAAELARERGEGSFLWNLVNTGTPQKEAERRSLQQYYNDAYESAPDSMKVLSGIGIPFGAGAAATKLLPMASAPIRSSAGLGAGMAGIAGYAAPTEPDTGDFETRFPSALNSARYGALIGALGAGGAKFAQSPSNALNSAYDWMRMNAPGPNQLNAITAFHGSPHDFDRFDMSKIGTGEGAQAFGHGLYFADSPQVAGSYKDIKGRNITKSYVGSEPYDENNILHKAALILGTNRNSKGMAIDNLARMAKTGVIDPDYASKISDVLKSQKDIPRFRQENSFEQLPGHLYEVNLDVEPEHLLDWDKPLSEQSDYVKKALGFDLPEEAYKIAQSHANELENIYAELGQSKKWRPGDEALTKRAHELEDALGKIDPKGFSQFRINSMAGGPEAANKLREAGIPGIRYLDQGSRTAGAGSHNYVIFDDKLVDIKGKK